MDLFNQEAETKKKKRAKKVNYDTSYCFDLSKDQLAGLQDFSKMEQKPMAKIIRESITEYINKRRLQKES